MKPLGITTAVLFIAFLVSVLAMPLKESAEARVQDDSGLTISGSVMVAGTREPVAGARVRLWAGRSIDRVLNPNFTSVTTDSNGRFSFSGLTAGLHHLQLGNSEGGWGAEKSVEVSGTGLPTVVELWMTPLSTVSGRVLDPNGEPIAGACVGLVTPVRFSGQPLLVPPAVPPPQSCETDEDGVYRLSVPPGNYHLRVDSLPGANLTVPQYYPGVVDTREAAPIALRAGVELGGVNIALSSNDGFRVRFRLALPDQLPGIPEPLSTYREAGDEIVEAWIRSAGFDAVDSGPRKLTLEALENDMWFTEPLPPGEYDLLLRYAVATHTALVSPFTQYDPNRARLDPIARVPIVVMDEELDLGTLSESPKVSVQGLVEFRSTTQRRPDLTALPALSFVDLSMGFIQRLAEVSVEGTFLVDALPPGLFGFSVPTGEIPDGWHVASVTSGGRDVLQDGLEVGGGLLNPIRVVFADDAAQLRGVVRRVDNALAPEARVVLIPSVNRRGPLTRFPSVLANASGAFTLEEVPPGEYRLLALDEAGRSAIYPYWEAPEFLREFERLGELITVDPNARMVINAESILLSD